MLDDKSLNLTSVASLGEFGLIDKITKNFSSKDASLLMGPGDDAAVYQLEGNRVLVSTTDILAEGVHFDLSYVPMQHLGYKSVVVNLSDIYAMNAKPFGVLVNIAFSNRFSVEAIETLYDGIHSACEFYGISLLGGDTSSSRAGLVITVTALGFGEKDKIAYRSGAKETDLICVSGDLGAAFAGLQVLEREKAVFIKNPEVQPDLSGFEYCVNRQLKPEARKDIIEEIENLGLKLTSMIDVSDGLASELHHICAMSKKGATIYQDKVPIDHVTISAADTFKISQITYALNGGEDYELLFTVPVTSFDIIKAHPDISIIGHITSPDRGVKLITNSAQEVEIPFGGFNHFGNPN